MYYKKWKEHYVKYVQVESELQVLLTVEEKDEYMEEFTDNGKTLIEFKEEIEKYLVSKGTELQHGSRHADDDVSQYSHASSRSKVSSLSAREKVEHILLQEQQKKAELLVRSEALSALHEMEVEAKMLDTQAELDKLRLEKKKKELALKTEIEVSTAKLEAVETILEQPIGEEPTVLVNTTPLYEPDVISPAWLRQSAFKPNLRAASTPYMQNGAATNPVQSELNPAATIYVPTPMTVPPLPEKQLPPMQPSTGTNDVTSVISSLADILTNKEDKLPLKEPDVFKGDVFEYPEWISSIVTQVECKYPKATDRLYYLGKYTSGEAKMCIKSLLSLNTEEAYIKAKKLLSSRYGNKLILANSYRERIEKWLTMKTGDGKALREFSDFLLQCETAMSTLSQLKVLDDADEHQKIIKKLPKHIQEKWMTYIDKWLYNEDNEQISDEYPPFSKLSVHK